MFLEETNNNYSNRWLTTVLTPSYQIREKIRLALLKENIESRPLWKPMHLQPFYSGHLRYENGISEELFAKGLCLPSGSNLTLKEKERVVIAIKKEIG